jgi:predicted ATPase
LHRRRCNFSSPAHAGALLDRLGERLALLTGGPRDAPARQRTLRATLDWSYDLLDPDARGLFAKLGVLAGGFTLDAAKTVCADAEEDGLLDALGALVDHSLLERRAGPDQEPRFGALEVVSDYALALLDSRHEGETVRRRHAEYYREFAAMADDGLRGTEQGLWLARLQAEDDNFRVALGWGWNGTRSLRCNSPACSAASGCSAGRLSRPDAGSSRHSPREVRRRAPAASWP